MTHKLELYHFSKTSEEFRLLVKATSENATRKDIKKGVELFEQICKNIIILNTKLSAICRIFDRRKMSISSDIIVKGFNNNDIYLQYDDNIEAKLESVEISSNIFKGPDEYFHDIVSDVQLISKYLDLEFDHMENTAKNKC